MKVTLPEADRAILERWMKSRSTWDKQRSRARMLLMTADGLPTKACNGQLKPAHFLDGLLIKIPLKFQWG
jgi:hypothetical protein